MELLQSSGVLVLGGVERQGNVQQRQRFLCWEREVFSIIVFFSFPPFLFYLWFPAPSLSLSGFSLSLSLSL